MKIPHVVSAMALLIAAPAMAATVGQVIAVAHNTGSTSGTVIDIDWTSGSSSSVTTHSNPTYAMAFNDTAGDWYAVQRASAGVQRLVILDPDTKAVSSVVGNLTEVINTNTGKTYNHKVTALGFSGNTLYGVSARWELVGGFWVPMGKLVTVDTSSGTVTTVGSLGHAVYSRGGKVDGGVFKLITYTDKNAKTFNLYNVNLSTGASTLVGSTGVSGKAVGMSLDPDGDLLAVMNGTSNTTSSLYTVSGTTGSASLVGSTGFNNLSAMAYGTIDISCGFTMGGALTIAGNATIDSWDSTMGAYNPTTVDDEAILCASGGVTLTQNSIIYGTLYYNAGLSVATSSTITGGTRVWVSDFTMPTVDVSSVSTNNDNDLIPDTSDGKSPFKRNTQKIDLKNASVLTFPAGTYYVTGISMVGTSQIDTSGDVILYVDGDIDIKDGALLNDGGDPGTLDIRATGTSVSVKANGEAAAQITAPNAIIELKGAGEFYGTLLGDEVAIKDDVLAHIDSALQ